MLKLDGISAGYSAISVLNGVSIEVGAGEFVSVVGPNGAGKSTMFKTISGTVRPRTGTIKFEDIDLVAVAPSRRAHLGIAHVPEGRQVFPSLTVMENLEMGAYTEAGRRHWRTNIERIFSLFPVLAERSNQFAGTLSGGEQQMLAIGRALMTNPDCLIMDEPSEGLAPIIIQGLWEAIGTLKKEGLSILLVEQNAHLALKLVDFVHVMSKGQVVYSAKPDELRANDAIKSSYLGI